MELIASIPEAAITGGEAASGGTIKGRAGDPIEAEAVASLRAGAGRRKIYKASKRFISR
jgi:hypothetical protein